MIKLAVGLIVVGILAFGIMAYAQGPGWGGVNMMGPGYGSHMMGQGYGRYMTGPKMGWRGSGYDQKFLDETSDVRKDLHNKKFEYFEATRNPDTKPETIAKRNNLAHFFPLFGQSGSPPDCLFIIINSCL
jgi:hypothetical protein